MEQLVWHYFTVTFKKIGGGKMERTVLEERDALSMERLASITKRAYRTGAVWGLFQKNGFFCYKNG